MVDLIRFGTHLFAGPWRTAEYFSEKNLARIEAAIRESEKLHSGEVRFVVEVALPLSALLRGTSPRTRALQIFSDLKIWDTEHNNGILLYLLLADRDIEIVADRGILKCLPQSGWDEICKEIENAFKKGDYEQGVVEGIQKMTLLLKHHFPGSVDDKDELENRPVVL